jgi:excisionase family DNA binding protein
MPAEPGSSVLTIDELAEYLKISKSTLYKLAQEGSIPSQKVGKHWRFHKDAGDQGLRQRGPSAPPPKIDHSREE